MNTTLSNYNMANIFNTYTDDATGQQYYNLYNTINIDGGIDSALYSIHIFSEGEDFYSLSQKYYNDIQLWWLILISNNIFNPFDDALYGRYLLIPIPSVASLIVTQINNA